MRIEVLSDHPGAQLQDTDAALASEQYRFAEHARAVDALRRRHQASRRWWQLGRRLRHSRELRELQWAAPKVNQRLMSERARQQAGGDAEDRVASELERYLDGDWTLFRGYANRRGEVDHLLVGPGGVWAVEVKGRAVRVHVIGDDWRFEKFDRYGNLKETGVLTDGGGRSWGRQVGEIAGALEEFLRRRGMHVEVRTAVVVMNDRAELGTCRRPGVDVVSIGIRSLLDQVSRTAGVLDREAQHKVADLVRRDHRFHAQRRARGRR
ncbi:nuclease-related domain-containing protein [Actinomadura luteofluorescens]|uniref:nuclease-related domain-containing protein n=1 Tax=Actinomadura luteofluorescens TaxID=46163 RepID=UPI003D91858D